MTNRCLSRSLSQVLFRWLLAAYLLEIVLKRWNLEYGCSPWFFLAPRLVHPFTKMALIRDAESWLQNEGAFSDGWWSVNVAINRFNNPPSRGCLETMKNGAFEILRKPHVYWSGRRDLNSRPLAPQPTWGVIISSQNCSKRRRNGLFACKQQPVN